MSFVYVAPVESGYYWTLAVGATVAILVAAACELVEQTASCCCQLPDVGRVGGLNPTVHVSEVPFGKTLNPNCSQ